MSSPAATSSSTTRRLVEKACTFLSSATDPFHAVRNSVLRLEAAGFARWQPMGTASLQRGGKYYYTVQNSTLVAFTVGAKVSTAEGGFLLIGGHTDSPNLRVKPRSKKPSSGGGPVQLNVECYGGGLWHTWFDRDLSLSGKVLVRKSGSDSVMPRLLQLEDPIARVSTLCIHLQSAEERKAFAVNKEDHTSPIILGQRDEQLEQAVLEQLASRNDPWQQQQEPALLQRIAQELNVSVKDIADFELSLYDTQPATTGGMNGEFLYSARLDNLATVFCAVEAISEADVSNSSDIHMVVCFDHEEVGSTSATGAGSPVIVQAMERIAGSLEGVQQNDLIPHSFILSIDQAHAVHPNYANKHQAQHRPLMNGGIVIKSNANQRYTTNSQSAFFLRELGRRNDIPMQEFCVRNDCPCGSTIGPTIAALTGIRTVDAGMPQLSMHSCREVMGVQDLEYGVRLFEAFFAQFRAMDAQVQENIEY